MTEKSIKENIEFINKYSIEDWITIIKDIFLDFKLFIKEEEEEEVNYVYNINNYDVEYIDGKIHDIKIKLCYKEKDDKTKCHLSSCFLDFEKPIGRGQYEIYNRIPIYALRLMNNFKN